LQGGTNSSEFRIPDAELQGSVELRIPSPQPSRLTPVPSDKILLPRRMLYVEAVLYLTVAASAFGLGYLAGRGGPSAAGKKSTDVQMQGVDGKVSLGPRGGATRGDAGAVVIVLPDGTLPARPLPIAGLRPGDPPPVKGDATSAALAELGGAAARAEASGDFALSVPGAESYRILIISRQATRGPDGPDERRDISELGEYFDAPADLLQRSQYRWLTKDIGRNARPIDVQFTE
jgi:hypothetical protein